MAVYLSDLSEREVSDGVSQALLDKAKAELDGIVGVFHALLQIAQIETGSPKAGFKPVDLVELCGTFRDLYEPAAAEAVHSLTFTHEDKARFEVLGDRGLLGQVLANLIENAIRHTQPDARITLSLTREDGRSVVSVSDNGPGVPPDERELVLRRLYRRDQSRSTPGAGLGLSLVSSIATLHGATVELEDNAPGLRVVLRFPAFVPD